MKRRSFLAALLALPILNRWRPIPSALPVVEEAALPAAPALAAATTVTASSAVAATVTTFPFFWDSELVDGLLAIPLLDTLIAEDIYGVLQ